MAQRRTPKPKKSETLEVRLDHETKQDFLERCRENGTTASDVVRSAIDRYLAKHKKPAWRPTPEANDGVSAMILPFVKQRKRVLAGGVGAVTLAAMVAMPSAAKPDLAAAFQRIDANGDGVISMEEFFGEQPSSEEIREEIRKVVRERGGTISEDATTQEMKLDAFALLIPPPDGDVDGQWGLRMEISQRSESDEDPAPVYPADPRQSEFAGMDTSGDGQVSREEFEERFRQLMTRGFEVLDQNGDGHLDRSELARSSMSSLVDDIDDADREESAPLTQVQLDAGFKALDGNVDSRISLEEYLSTI